MMKMEGPTGVENFDPEIERLLYIERMIGILVSRVNTLLEPHDFPHSLAAIAVLKDNFTREMEHSLLRAYDRAPVLQIFS